MTGKKTLQLEIDTTEMTPAQIRLVKRMNAMFTHVLTADTEENFFEGSAELMRVCASLIQQARFTDDQKRVSKIPYADQALEYSMDILQEHMSEAKVVSYDN